MNRRIKKKKAKPIIEICKTIKVADLCSKQDFGLNDKNKQTFWYCDIPNPKDYDFNDIDDRVFYKYEWDRVYANRQLIYKIVKKAYKDNFNIKEYAIWEIPYFDNEGCFIFFININDIKKDKGRGIAFFVESKKNGVAIPHKDIKQSLYPKNTCQEAVCLTE